MFHTSDGSDRTRIIPPFLRVDHVIRTPYFPPLFLTSESYIMVQSVRVFCTGDPYCTDRLYVFSTSHQHSEFYPYMFLLCEIRNLRIVIVHGLSAQQLTFREGEVPLRNCLLPRGIRVLCFGTKTLPFGQLWLVFWTLSYCEAATSF